MAHFWRGDEDNKRRMHWMAWWKMCLPKNQGGIGFRDIHCFDLAMLTKQAWRLFENPNSLCATILRVKYFPDGGLLNAKLKRDPRYHGKVLWYSLKNGYIWRVGNGQSIDIWDDTWIPNCSTRKVITLKGGRLLSRVVDFIDPVSNSWDEDLVRQTLWPTDAQRVLAIPLPHHDMQDFPSHHDMQDFVAWNFTKNGLFSVRSAYFVEWDHQHGMKLTLTNGMGRPLLILLGARFGSFRARERLRFLFRVHCMVHFRVVLRLPIDI